MCSDGLIVKSTTALAGLETFTSATELSLPSKLTEVDAAIISSLQGPRGKMVGISVATIAYHTRGSKDEVMTDLVLNPTKSESRAAPTFSWTRSRTPNPSSDLSTGAKAGIGAGVGVVEAIAILDAGLFLLRNRKSEKSKGRDHPGRRRRRTMIRVLNNSNKAELATGPDVETQLLAELPDKLFRAPVEIVGNEYPGMHNISASR
ncbi:hypothetical protein PMIN07_010129 [Paraphaeosphaeria minitans]